MNNMKLNRQKVSDKLYGMIPGVKTYDFMQSGERTCIVEFSVLPISTKNKEEFTLHHLNKIGEEFGDNEIVISVFPGRYKFRMMFMVTNKEYYEAG